MKKIFLHEKDDLFCCFILMYRAEDDLEHILESNTQLDLEQFYLLFRDTITGLNYLHGNKIAHRDIKSGNIMKAKKNRYF